MKTRGELNTEKRNPNSHTIDSLSVDEILSVINEEDTIITKKVNAAIPEISESVKYAVNSIKNGGRVFYIGAGTSGRLGVLDASEIPPTYSAPKNYFIAFHNVIQALLFISQEKLYLSYRQSFALISKLQQEILNHLIWRHKLSHTIINTTQNRSRTLNNISN